MAETEGWVVTCPATNSGTWRLMGWKKAALFFKTRQDAREFVWQWRKDTKDSRSLKVERAALKSADAPREGK